jgi:hypothetical protein
VLALRINDYGIRGYVYVSSVRKVSQKSRRVGSRYRQRLTANVAFKAQVKPSVRMISDDFIGA